VADLGSYQYQLPATEYVQAVTLAPVLVVSLFAIDPASGALPVAGDFACDGMLPKSAVFDCSRRLDVANCCHLDDLTAGGSTGLWRVAGEAHGRERLQLVKTK